MSFMIDGVEVITLADAAEMVGVSAQTLKKWASVDIDSEKNKFGFGGTIAETEAKGTYLNYDLFIEAAARKAEYDESRAAVRTGATTEDGPSASSVTKLEVQAFMWAIGLDSQPHEKKLDLLGRIDWGAIDWGAVEERIAEMANRLEDYYKVFGPLDEVEA